MTTPPPSYASREEYRASNQRMAEAILAADPDPYIDGGVRRVVEVRGRRSGQTRLLPIAVLSLDRQRYLISPTLQRNWVLNLLAEPRCTVRTRDNAESAMAVPVHDPDVIADAVALYVRLMKAPWAIAQFPFPADATREQIRAAADHIAVFRLDQAN
jgi:deazaflavin-dependent oxidoreductase (nitroreductase family)